MDAKPEWVPEWVWAEFVDFRRWRTADTVGDDTLPRIYRRMDTIVRARGCTALWRAVGNRRAVLQKRGALIGLPEGFRVCGILLEIAENAEGVPHEEALSAAARKKLGGAIAKRARDLHDALDDMERGGTPRAFNGPLDSFAKHYSENYVPHEGVNGMFSGAEQSPEMAAACIAGYNDAVGDLASGDFGGLLDALERAGMALADSAPPVAHLASPDAARLHFVRETTKDMRFHFGQPLREPVAALTRVLFGCEMDAATVAKLAP